MLTIAPILLLIIMVFDTIFTVKSAKSKPTKFAKKLPYSIGSFIIILIMPATMVNLYIISATVQGNVLQILFVYLICSCLLSLFYEGTKHKFLNLVMVVAFNILYAFVVLPNINGVSIVYTIVTLIAVALTYICILDIIIDNIVSAVFIDGERYSHAVTVALYVLVLMFFTNFAPMRYVNMSFENGYVQQFISQYDHNQSAEDDSNVTYTPTSTKVTDTYTISKSLPVLSQYMIDTLPDDYKTYQVGEGIVWLLNDKDCKNFEILEYLQAVCKDHNYNPYRIMRKLFEDYLYTDVQDFESTATFDSENNLNLDYTQQEDESPEDFVKRMYLDIIKNFYSGSIDLDDIPVGTEDTQKYVFTVYFNETTQTYDIFSLYFYFDNDGKFISTHYDVVSISDKTIPIYSNYVDIIPSTQDDTFTETYREYHLDGQGYVLFKYYG